MSATLLVKASLLWALALIAGHLLRKASPGSRHRLWSLAFAALLALPLLGPLLPALRLPLPVTLPRTVPPNTSARAAWLPAASTPGGRSALTARTADAVETPASLADRARALLSDRGLALSAARNATPAIETRETRETHAPLTPQSPTPQSIPSQSVTPQSIASLDRLSFISLLAASSFAAVTSFAAASGLGASGLGSSSASIVGGLWQAVWLIGALAAAGTMLLSLLRVRSVVRRAAVHDDPMWRAAADALAARLGLRRPVRLLLCDGIGTPMAGGVWQPTVFLPRCARGWSAEQRDVVLAHEIAHLAGGDPLRHLAARAALTVYWFHPLAWMVARRATVAREQACDETVLALGTRPSVYARVLLDLADALHPFAQAAPALGALPMVERSLLEARLMAILDDQIRPATRRRVLMPAVGVALLTLSVAAARPVARVADVPMVPPIVPTTTVLPGATTVRPATAQPTPETTTSDADAARDVNEAHAAHAVIAAGQAGSDRDSVCAWDLSRGGSFSGSMWTSDVGGRTVIREQVGSRGTDRVIQKTFGDVRVCMVAQDVGSVERNRPLDPADRPSQWLGRASRVTMETRRGDALQRLAVVREGSGQRTSWQVNGAERPFDAAAQQWRDRMLGALDATWELAVLHGQASSLRGQISAIHGEESALRGRISALRGEVSSLQGDASSVRGEESSLRGRIASINGHVSSLRGQISAEMGTMSSIRASEYGATPAEREQIAARMKRHEGQIARIDREIRDYDANARIAEVEKSIAALDAKAKVAAVEKSIREFDLDGRIAGVEREIGALDVDGKVAGFEREIAALDLDRRGGEIKARLDAALKQLESSVAAIR